MNELHRANKWIYDKLVADSAIVAAVEDRIYAERAPEAAEYPFVLFNLQSGGQDTRGNCTTRLMAKPLYQIKLITDELANETDSAAILAAVDAIDTLFQEAVTEISETMVFSARREFPIYYQEPKQNSSGLFSHYGGAYRLFIYPEA